MISIKKKIINFINKFLNKINIQLIKKSFFEKLLRNQIDDLKITKKNRKKPKIKFY